MALSVAAGSADVVAHVQRPVRYAFQVLRLSGPVSMTRKHNLSAAKCVFLSVPDSLCSGIVHSGSLKLTVALCASMAHTASITD
eukprot:1463853-Rhodomonas_salina.3